jgi:hypothetical protein
MPPDNQFPNPGGIPFGPEGDPIRRQLEQFVLAFDSNLAPIVGQQTTLTATDAAVSGPRIDLLIARANVGECELVAKAAINEVESGFLYSGAGVFSTNRAATPPISDAALRAIASVDGQQVTYTCVPPGSGTRIAIDRDGDGYLDGDELDAGTDPADPNSYPGH